MENPHGTIIERMQNWSTRQRSFLEAAGFDFYKRPKLRLRVAKGCVAGGLAPRAEHCVVRDCGSVFLGRGQEFPSHQPAYSRLYGTLGNANGLREFLIAHLNRRVHAPVFDGKPQIYEEADRPSVVADQIVHEHVDDVGIQCGQ
jgi:hypothetical protein